MAEDKFRAIMDILNSGSAGEFVDDNGLVKSREVVLPILSAASNATSGKQLTDKEREYILSATSDDFPKTHTVPAQAQGAAAEIASRTFQPSRREPPPEFATMPPSQDVAQFPRASVHQPSGTAAQGIARQQAIAKNQLKAATQMATQRNGGAPPSREQILEDLTRLNPNALAMLNAVGEQ